MMSSAREILHYFAWQQDRLNCLQGLCPVNESSPIPNKKQCKDPPINLSGSWINLHPVLSLHIVAALKRFFWLAW